MAARGQHLWQTPGCPMAAQKHAPWQAPGRLLARARRAYRWPAARVLARARTGRASRRGGRCGPCSSAGCSGPALRGVALPPREGRARSSGPGDEGGAFEGPGGGFCGDRRGRRSARAREKKGEGAAGGERERTAREKRTGNARETAAGWYRTSHQPRFSRSLYPILPTCALKSVGATSLLSLWTCAGGWL